MSDTTKQQKLESYCEKFAKMFPEVKEISVSEVQAMMDSEDSSKLVLVDVRLPEEQEVSIIPGNTLSKEEFEARSADFKDAKVICYCTVGYRSCGYAQQLSAKQFDAYNLRGSILAWTQAGLPLVDGRDRSSATSRVHVFSQQFAVQGDGYEAVAFQQPMMKYVAGMVRSYLPPFLRW